MYVRIFWGKIKPGRWDEYEAHYNENIQALGEKMPGFSGRQLLRSTENPDEGISITFWDSKDEVDAYDRSPQRHANARAADHLYAGEYWVKHFEVRSTDIATYRWTP